ncbi:MAG: sulfatase-like hydrolase/transferase [Verrucomicrobiota bacterium]
MKNSLSRILTVGAMVLAGLVGFGTAADKPNVLFIFADDQCFETIRELGNLEIETPNLDRLVKRGTTFTHAYNMGSWSGAVCVASRHMLNTGVFLWHAEKEANAFGGKAKKPKKGEAAVEPVTPDEPNFQERNQMWSQLMSAAGYKTYFTGKWHVKANAEEIFDVTGNVRGGMPAQTPDGYNRPLPGEADPWDPADPKFGGFWEGGKHWSEVVGDKATGFLESAAKEDDPFFMYIAFNAPHDPRQAPQEFVDMYPVEQLKVPVNFVPEYPYNEDMKSGRTLRDEKLAPFPRTVRSVKVHRQEYYAIITHMDQEIGRILDALDASGKADDTYIFYSADHGLAVGQHGLMGKQNMFDHSMRVPLIVAGPGIEGGKKIEGAVYLQDIMASVLELGTGEVPEHVQFKSLMPVLKGERDGNYDAVYGAYLDGQRAVIEDGYKLILYPQVPVALLFNLEKDPAETKDLAEKKGQQKRMQSMFQTLLELQKETGDELDLKGVYPDLAGE